MKVGLLTRSSLRFYRRHPWQLVLAVAGIALGVAVFVGIQLANDSARRAFELSSAAVRGQTTHRLLPVSGFLPVATYVALKSDPRYVASAPVLEVPVRLAIPGGPVLELTLEGLDVIEEAAVRGVVDALAGGGDPLELIAEPGAVVVPESLAMRFGIAAGDSLDIGAGEAAARVVVIGMREDGTEDGPALVADIATAQEIAGRIDALSRIDLRLDEAAAAALATDPPAGTVLVSALGEDQTLAELTRAFETNLTALGLLALVVGMFLIYSTISFTIVQRWRSIAVLRAIGLDRRELVGKLLGEALAIGVTGTVLGLVLGRELSAGLLELVLRTLDDLYFRRALGSAESSGFIYVYSAAIGIGATLGSALIPATLAARREITSASRSRLERSALVLARRFAFAAVPTLALAGLVLGLVERGLAAAFAALFLVLVAGAMLVPLATHGLMRILERPLGRIAGLPGRMAARGVTDSLSRTGVATAALAVAVATVLSIGLMISSFRASLVDWIDTTVTADLYVSIDPSWTGLEPVLDAVEALPEIAGVSRMRAARIATLEGDLNIRAAAPGPEGYGIDVTRPEAAAAETLLAGERALLVSEPLAFRLGLEPGDALELPTATGLERFEVAGIYRDYNTSGAELILALGNYRRWFEDDGLTSIGVHLAARADASAAEERIRDLLGPERRTQIRSTGFIREISLVIFDRTFQVTEVLRLLAGIVAFLGIMSAVMALQLEREREFAVLRSLGMSIRELFGQNLAQTALLGLAAGLAALPLGIALAWLLVHVINLRSFGWSMDFVVSLDPMLAALAMAIGAAVLAGLYPALVGARADMGLAWRDD